LNQSLIFHIWEGLKLWFQISQIPLQQSKSIFYSFPPWQPAPFSYFIHSKAAGPLNIWAQQMPRHLSSSFLQQNRVKAAATVGASVHLPCMEMDVI
jgi:hypothetical protein